MSDPFSNQKVGSTKTLKGMTKNSLRAIMQNQIEKADLLKIDPHIQTKYGDEGKNKLSWVKFSDFQQNGGHHPDGWQIVRMDDEDYAKASDFVNPLSDNKLSRFFHKNELVLASKIKDTYNEEKENERLISMMRRANANFDLSDDGQRDYKVAGNGLEAVSETKFSNRADALNGIAGAHKKYDDLLKNKKKD